MSITTREIYDFLKYIRNKYNGTIFLSEFDGFHTLLKNNKIFITIFPQNFLLKTYNYYNEYPFPETKVKTDFIEMIMFYFPNRTYNNIEIEVMDF